MFFVAIPRKIAKERSLKHYYSLTPCKEGQWSHRLTVNFACDCSICNFKRKARQKIYRKNAYVPKKAGRTERYKFCITSLFSSIKVDTNTYVVTFPSKPISDCKKELLKVKLDVMCNIHNYTFKSSLKSLSKNIVPCRLCRNAIRSKLYTLSQQEALNKLKDKPDSIFLDFSKFIYSGYKNMSIFGCKRHATTVWFEQEYRNILKSPLAGCQSCNRIVSNTESNVGYSKTNFIERSKTGLAQLYVVKCYKDDEQFYKIGLTSRDLKTRFRQLPYNYHPVLLISSENPGLIFDLEKQLHSIFKNVRHITNIYFKGKTECFSDIDGILDHIPFNQVEVITNLLSQQEIAA